MTITNRAFFWILQIGALVLEGGFIFSAREILRKMLRHMKLKRNGKTGIALVTHKTIIKHKNRKQYVVNYMFNADKQKSFHLIYGYVRKNEMDFRYLIPLSLAEIILSYYGRDMITDYNYFSSTMMTVQSKDWKLIEIGAIIEIIYDENNPKSFNMPLSQFEYMKNKEQLSWANCTCFQRIAYIILYFWLIIVLASFVAVYGLAFYLMYLSFDSTDSSLSIGEKWAFVMLSWIFHSIVICGLYFMVTKLSIFTRKKPSQYRNEKLLNKSNYLLMT
eukprot:24075_1